MRSTLIGLSLAAMLSLLLVPIVASAQAVGCCCDPVLFTGSFSTKEDCNQKGFDFIGPPPSIEVSCSEHCEEILTGPPKGFCGDDICQATETQQNCPEDCAPVVVGCGSPTYKPAPKNTIVSPIKGKKALRLGFNLPCPADYLNISRCKGTDCTNFQKIAEIPETSFFIDEDPELEFNKDYTYSITAHYRISGDSQPATARGNAGDIECWEQNVEKFCINNFYYDQYKEYLKKYGYGQYSSAEFTNSFGSTANLTFATRFNQAWQCENSNRLLETSPKVSCDIRKEEYCISDELGPRCVKKSPCSTGADPFGLLATKENCEGILPSRYCFYDKSKTTPDKCYNCNPRMACYDYKSKSACERDNCGAGDCQWNTIYEDIGTGVCIDKRFNNCRLCSKKGTPGMENLDAASEIWDACREEKSNALSNALYPCFFDKDRKVSKTCDEVSCSDYTGLQCGSPDPGVRLNPDNSLRAFSTDVCKIGVCEYHLTTGCIKNADGNTGTGFQDCRFGDKKCELDYFPPATTLIPTGVAGRIDLINIRIFDKLNKTLPPKDFVGKTGYKTYLCIRNETHSCTDAREFPIITNITQLTLKNTVLKQGEKVLAKLDTGDNKIVYYSRDRANNVEVLKETNVFACAKCNGPKLTELTVTGGTVVGNKIYTSATKPTFTFKLDEPTQITFAQISRKGESVQLSQLTPGMVEVHEFTPVASLLGRYNFSVNGHNDKQIYFDPPGLEFELIVDPELAGLTIAPSDGSIINATTVDLRLNFSRPVTLDRINLVSVSFDNQYAITETKEDITKLFKSEGNKTFTAKLEKLKGGKYTIEVKAKGFNSLDVYKQSSFFIATEKPGIRLVKPEFGETAFSVYDAIVETAIPGECAYVYDTPSPPNSADYQFFKKFEGLGTLHTAKGLNIPFGASRDYLLHTYCKIKNFGITQRTFNITLDPEPPIIEKAFAEPSVIAEEFIPDQKIYSTTLKVQLSKPGFCKYSLITSNFDSMEKTFPGYDKLPKKSLGADVNVTEVRQYKYYIACKGKNQLVSEPTTIPFEVDLTLGLNVTSNTPVGFGTLDFTIGVVANKRVICYFGERQDDTTRCMGACTSGYTQRQDIKVESQGEYTYYVKCAHFSGEQSKVIKIPVLVDTTPPEMKYVNDDGIFEDDLDITWSQNKIRVAFLAEDKESGISHYLITLQDQESKQVIVNNLVSNVIHGEPIYISTTESGKPFRLSNDRRYNFKVKAVNRVGLESEIMESDGARVDTTRQPEQCMNAEQDGNEADIDCGRECDPCQEGSKCTLDDNCATNYCEQGRCKIASCEDGVQNGLESDVDCGGQVCEKCKKERACIQDSDCETDYCDEIEAICADAPPCADKTLSPGETDIDCGGACKKCGEGKTCQESTDCHPELSCHPSSKTCTSEPIGDEDHDGITDDADKCPGTPPDEEANQKGCGPSQTYSLGDEIDDRWRLDHFGCIECPEAAPGADPDKDKLTNIEEYNLKTNPTKKDTDGDRWNDGKEVEKGTDPTNPASHPPSIFLNILWIIFILLVIGGIYYGILIALKAKKERKKPIEKPAEKPEEKPPEVTKEDELRKLRTFAKEEELEEKEWIPLEAEIKKKPLPAKKFEEALEKLRKIAHKEREKPDKPLLRLRQMLEELSEEEITDLIAGYKLLRAGLLTAKEKEMLFKRLRITAEYYKTHKEELEKELEAYGKPHRKKR